MAIKPKRQGGTSYAAQHELVELAKNWSVPALSKKLAASRI
jgi:hypothetical protein